MIRNFMFKALAFSVLAFAGCSDIVSPVAPIQEQQALQNGLNLPIVTDLLKKLLVQDLPKAKTSKGGASATAYINAGSGGSLRAKFSYVNVYGKTTSVEARVVIPAGALKNSGQITMILDTIDCAVRFQPEGLVFNKPLALEYSATNIKLISLPLQLGFFYDNEKGLFVSLPAILSVDLLGGYLGAKECKVPHFSRYAFGR